MSRTNSGPGFRRLPRIADQMTPDLFACVERAFAAERAGDAATALEWHQAVPMFRRGRHRGLLDRLSRLDGDLPPWVWARWIVYQSLRCEDPGSRTARLHRRFVSYVVEAFHADLLDECHDEGGDPVQVIARVLGESWACHQLFPHEFGGLVSFIDEFPTGALAEHADLARSWAGVPLGGYRVGARRPGCRLEVHDAATGRAHHVIDLGARSCAGPDGWVLGRLVPSGMDDALVFDLPPLAVPERIAREVAAVQGERPWAPVTEALEDGRLDPGLLLREDYELTTDVPELELVRFGTAPADYQRVMAQLRAGRDEVGRASYRILRRALDDAVDATDAPYVGAAALNPHAYDEARDKLVRAGQHDVWARWADLVVEPGRGRLLAFAEAARSAA